MKKLIITLIFMFLLLGSVSGAEWDNKIKYSENDLKVELENWFGLGENYGSAKLESHKSVEEIKKVGTGWQVNMYYDFNFTKDYEGGLGEVIFIDEKTGKEVKRDYKFVYQDTEIKEREVCSSYSEIETKNGTTEKCSSYETEKYETKVWKDYDSKDIPKGNIRIGIMVDNKQGDYIDGIWTIGGKKVSRHASWSASLEIDLVAYYKLDETSGDVVDSHGDNDGTNHRATRGETGKIGNCFYFDGSDDYVDIDVNNLGHDYISVSFWFNADNFQGNGERLIDAARNDDANQSHFIGQADGNNLNFVIYTNDGNSVSYTTSQDFNTGQWYHAVMTYDGSALKVYIDGNEIGSSSHSAKVRNYNIVSIGLRKYNYLGNLAEDLNYDGKIDEVGYWSRALTSDEVSDLYNDGLGISYRGYPINVYLLSPEDDYISSTDTIDFSANVSDPENYGIENVSLYINDEINQTNSSGVEGIYNWSLTDLSDGNYDWYVGVVNSTGDTSYSTIRDFSIDTNETTIDVENPTGIYDYSAEGNTETLNVTITSVDLDTCWYNYNGTNITIDDCVSEVKNSETFNLEDYGNSHNMTIYANDTAGNIASDYIEWEYKIFEHSQNYNSTTYETASESFSINIPANSSLTDVELVYDGDSYSTSKSGNIYSKTLQMPLVSEDTNKTFYWKYTYDGSTINSEENNQTVQPIKFTRCNSTYNEEFINFSFKDEDTLNPTEGQLTSFEYSYWLGDGTKNISGEYINQTNQSYFDFCFSPSNREINVDMYLQYKNDDAPQRIYDPSTIILTNQTTNQTLYLLSSSDGIYVTIQVINLAEQAISGVDINVTREISGETVLVGQGQTGSAGSVTFWLNPDFRHTFTLSKEGYDTLSESLTPTNSEYTFTFGSEAEAEDDYSQGISQTIRPSQSYVDNGTSYNFSYTLGSSYWDVDRYGFTLYYDNGTEIATRNANTNGGTLSALNILVGGVQNEQIYMDYYYEIDSNYENRTITWIIQSTEGRDYSLFNFFNNLDTNLEAGLFGIGDFGRAIFAILFIVMVVGGISLRYGIRSEPMVLGIMFGVILILDYVLEIIPDLTIGGLQPIDNFASFIVFIVLIGLLIKEEFK